MKKLMFILAATLTALAGRAALPQPDLIAEIHFAGGDRISASKNYPTFATEFSSAEALALRKQTADKLAPWLAGWLQANLGTTVPDGAAKLRPLFEDLQTAEWFLEARTPVGGQPDVAIAVNLSPARVQAWEAALKPFFPAATFKESKQNIGWLLFDSGTGTGKAGELLAQKISTSPVGWVSADINWPRLAQWYPALKGLALPETQLEVIAPDANLHIKGKMFFPENLSLKLDAWQFPSNTVHQPIISFTAARGFAGWLAGQDWAKPLELSPPVNQLFTWALNGMPYNAFAAVPVADSNMALQQLATRLQPVVAERNAHDGFIYTGALDVTNTQITLTGEPMLQPYVKAITEPSGNFLLAGELPNVVKSKPLPPELLQRLTVTNLVFYHWEYTAQRLPLMLTLSQYALVLTRQRQLEGESIAYNWVNKISSTLGNTFTEITQTAPDQFTFTRQAPGGLTAFEIISLANWLQGADFPHCNLSLPPISERVKKARAKHPAPAPTTMPAMPTH